MLGSTPAGLRGKEGLCTTPGQWSPGERSRGATPDPSAGREQEDLQALAHRHNARGANSVNAEPQSPAFTRVKINRSQSQTRQIIFLCQGINQLSLLLTTLHTR